MKKIIKYALVGLGLFLIHQKCTLASSEFELEQDPNTLTYKIERTDKTVRLYFYIVRDKETKEYVYCLEPGVQLSDETYEELEEWEYQKVHLSEEQKEYISKVAYYGYQYPGHEHLYYYYAAQLLIWECIIPDNWNIYYTDYLGGSEVKWFQNERREILELIEKEKTLPSFAGQSFTWNGKDTLKIEDTNHELEQYKIMNQTTSKVKQVNNSLVITSSEKKKETIEFQKEYLGNPIQFYYREDGQNTMRKGRISPKKFQITIAPYFLDFQILKTDETASPLSDVMFGLYAKEDIKNSFGEIVYKKDTLIEKKTTNQEGKIKLSNLYEGKYYLKEENTPKGYEPLKEKIEVIVSKDKTNETIKITNKKKTQNLIIQKQDDETKEILAGVHFQIWKEEECVFDGFTNDLGIIELENLSLGEYKIVEIETIFGYEILKNPTYFTLDGEEKTLNITITNHKIEKVPNTSEESISSTPIYEKKRKYHL